jgi:hypothetical protein
MRELWTNVNSYNLCPSMIFGDDGFFYVVFFFLEDKGMHFSHFDLE